MQTIGQMSYYPDFAALVNDALARLDHSPTWLAGQLGVYPSTVTRWLNEGTRPRNPETVVRVADLLGLASAKQALLIAAGFGYQEMPDVSTRATGAADTLNHLATSGSPFVGRDRELGEIADMLVNPDCRLLMLVGPGGMGKTRLAIQVAHGLVSSGRATQTFTHGVYFVPLAPATDVNGLAATVSQTILADLYGSSMSPRQLISFLAEKHLLLVLDNLEHLAEAASLLADLLAEAPSVKLLVTSRETLDLAQAWLYPLGGLPVTKEEHTSNLGYATENDTPDAVRLFVDGARRIQPRFELGQHAAAVSEICRLVGGMPLAIELAAAWTNVMSPQAIAAELRQGLDILTARHASIPPRHYSIRVVLGESWRLLAPEERALFDRLSVFRGGFRLDAGREVAGASVTMLAELVDRVLIQLDAAGRFQMHELLRQFAAENLVQDAEQQASVHTLHSRYYLALLVQQHPRLASHEHQAAFEIVHADFENIAAAWRWAVSCEDYFALGQAVAELTEFCVMQGCVGDGAALLEQFTVSLAGSEHLQRHREVYGRALACLGHLLTRLDRGEEGVASAQRSLEFVEDDPDRAFALVKLAHCLSYQGRSWDAEKALRESVALYRQIGDDPIGLATALYRWAVALQVQDARHAQQISHEAIAACRGTQRQDLVAQALLNAGAIDSECGDCNLALIHLQEALTIAEQLGYRVSTAWASGHIAWNYVCWGKAEHPDVLPYQQRAMTIFRELGMRSSYVVFMADHACVLNEQGHFEQAVAVAHEAVVDARGTGNQAVLSLASTQYGDILTRMGAYDEAHQALREALAAAYSVRQDHTMLNALCCLGELLVAEIPQTDPPAHDARLCEAAAYLTIVAHHPATWHYYRKKATRLLETLAPTYLPDDNQRLTLDDVVPKLL